MLYERHSLQEMCLCVLKHFSYLLNVPLGELGWYLNLMKVFIHADIEMGAEPLQP